MSQTFQVGSMMGAGTPSDTINPADMHRGFTLEFAETETSKECPCIEMLDIDGSFDTPSNPIEQPSISDDILSPRVGDVIEAKVSEYPSPPEGDITIKYEPSPIIHDVQVGGSDVKPVIKRRHSSRTRTHTRSSSGGGRPLASAVSKTTSPRGGKRNHRRSSAMYPCDMCQEKFNRQQDLTAHTMKQHQHRFPCPFAFAGCDKVFHSKNEWKRHAMTKHLLLQYWECTLGECATGDQGTPFNRKDLFTQHLKRMHSTPDEKEALELPKAERRKEPLAQDWQRRLSDIQDASVRQRCHTPNLMHCPAANGCMAEFHGEDAWDERMEHIARHHDRGVAIRIGDQDPTLVKWAASPGVDIVRKSKSGRWELVVTGSKKSDPMVDKLRLKRSAIGRDDDDHEHYGQVIVARVKPEDEDDYRQAHDVDADGEECFDEYA
jgi:hypothetical protein